ncbi:hypothetical protein POJ06DRAFT_205379 [Lipomyces tetrasporus]|uniref:Ubiquitin-like domain-containing protein n=1 Tax=Lipomyces tetrasporus TaxID=54092 RepID=A0AAD7QZG5_9ASCO|nr:uncharacterized protein POJ06DRAFT_205379 [Lipomyces tetrasporus]KAJ8104326.1 hypothetical protein POJ06DRAFT_205379 [Lipomyces tetrasporus]
MTTVDEETFCKAFLHLLSNQPLQHPDDYAVDPKLLGPRSGLVLLPHMRVPKQKKLKSETKSIQTASLTIKTLRPPHFSASFDAPYNDTILSIKTEVVEETGLPMSKLKFLVKGKVLPDTRTVGEIVDDKGKATIMVMVAPGATTTAKEVEAEEEEMEIDDDITDDVWSAIEAAVVGKLGEVKASKVMERIRTGYDLTK